MDILHAIAERTKIRIDERKKNMPLDRIMDNLNTPIAAPSARDFHFEKVLRASGDIAFICEVKKASPSLGIFAESFEYMDIAAEYENAGAAAISVLTEPYYFHGCDRYLNDISKKVSLPLLRKDFVVDEYMIYEAKLLGAGAVLLICAILDQKTLAKYIKTAHGLGMSALVETHDEEELKMALDSGARIIGANNRNLKTFEIDMGTSLRLRKLTPDDVVFVSESGIHTANDVQLLRQNGVDAILVGEALMRATDKKAALEVLRRT